MLTVTIDTAAAEKRIAEMLATLKKVGTEELGHELRDWQADDMNRKRPRTRISGRGKRASTIIRPHSRAEMTRSHRALMRAKRRKHSTYRRWSTRPILRAELFTKLVERMHKLAAMIKW